MCVINDPDINIVGMIFGESIGIVSRGCLPRWSSSVILHATYFSRGPLPWCTAQWPVIFLGQSPVNQLLGSETSTEVDNYAILDSGHYQWTLASRSSAAHVQL